MPVLPLLARRTATGTCSRPRRLGHRALSLPDCRCTRCPFRRRGAAVPSADAVPSLTSALPRREHCVTVQGTAREQVQSHTHGAVQTPSRRVRRAWRMGCNPCPSAPSHCCSLQSMSAALGTGRLFPRARHAALGTPCPGRERSEHTSCTRACPSARQSCHASPDVALPHHTRTHTHTHTSPPLRGRTRAIFSPKDWGSGQARESAVQFA